MANFLTVEDSLSRRVGTAGIFNVSEKSEKKAQIHINGLFWRSLILRLTHSGYLAGWAALRYAKANREKGE